LSGNYVASNSIGFWLDWDSTSNTLSGNTVTANNDYGIELMVSGNKIFHNNFINNGQQAISWSSGSNTWDDGYPLGGNYCSDYVGVDVENGPFQNVTGSDGIGDTPYTNIGQTHDVDHYPFMKPNGWENPPVSIESNVTVTVESIGKASLCLAVSGPSGQAGYINVTMAVGFNTTAIRVFVDMMPVQPPFPIITTNVTDYFIYFEFTMGTHQISMVYAPWTTLAEDSDGITGYKLLFNETLGNPFNSMVTINYYWNISLQKWNGTQWLASGISASSAPVTGYSLLALTTAKLPCYMFLLPNSGPNAVTSDDWLKVSYSFYWTYNGTNYSASYLEKLNVHPGDTSGAAVVSPYFGSDGKVSTADLTLLAREWGKGNIPWTGTFNPIDDLHRADTGMYGKISTGDLTILARNWGKDWSNSPPPA